MRMLGALTLTALLAGVVPAQTATNQPRQLPMTGLKPVSVAAFKNGLGFFIRQGRAETKDGEGYLTRIPEAALGTLWVSPADGNWSLDELVATTITSPVKYAFEVKNAGTVADLVSANVGKRVTVTFGDKEVSGFIRSFAPSLNVGNSGATLGSPNTLLYLEVGEGPGRSFIPFQAGDVKRVVFYEVPSTTLQVLRPEVTPGDTIVNDDGTPGEGNKNRQRVIRFKTKGAPGPVNLSMGYLRGGFGWSPAYRIVLDDDKTATLSMQSVVVNDAEDIENAEVFFVVGFPNFAFSRVLSPMTLQQSLAEFLASINRAQSESRFANDNFMSNAITVQRASPYRGGEDESGGIGGMIGGAAQSEEDLFLYGRQNVTLAKGERATYNVFSGKVNYEHVYEWDVADAAPINVYGGRNSGTSDSAPEKIWHSLRLSNSLKLPWTTAPILVMSGTRPLAQDTLLYTPAGATTNLHLTLATDIRVSKNEQESTRENNSVTINRNSYSVVTVTGSLTLKNYKAKDVRMCVRKSVVGEVLTISQNGKFERTAEAVQAVNPVSRLSWDFPLKAGEEVTLTYRYKVLVN